MASEVTLVAPGASSSSYNFGPRVDNLGPGTLPSAAVVIHEGQAKKKRGRPRKYAPEGPTSMPFSPSSSAPPVPTKSRVAEKKMSLERPINSERKYRNKVGAEKLDDWDDCLTGSSFLPHVITVNAGEDISAKIVEFSQRGPRSVCVLCGNGTVSSITIRHPNSSGGTCTYEGLFEILSFTGSFNPIEIEDSKFGRCGTMAISLAGADGRVIGGFIGGHTIAASPIKVIVASFLLGETYPVLKPNKQKMEIPFAPDRSGPSGPPGPSVNFDKRVISFGNASQGPSRESPNTNWEPTQVTERPRKSTADINISLQG
ncbi:AT-hook motif nuclear-localized protein 1 [Striga hermonthica]|uniref:AT-hook motif nuclear-localized protein n=1 Tax=Striga hermonthica TaxID=68872 RepID=A0A9N7MSB0_STRHE|nr:AT-hook motif nuclear-localized protein 1 [Striga hermonthica]